MPSLMFGSWVPNEIWIIDLSSALVGMLMSSSKLFLFSNKAHLNSGVRLLLELHCVVVIKHIAFFTICAKILVRTAFTFTFLDVPVHVIVVSDLKKNIGGTIELVKKDTDRRICILVFTSSLTKHGGLYFVLCNFVIQITS